MTPTLDILNRFLTIPIGIPEWIQDHIDAKVEEARREFQDSEMMLEQELRDANATIEEFETNVYDLQENCYRLERHLEDEKNDHLDTIKELEEQARLNGMGAEREARLLSRIAELLMELEHSKVKAYQTGWINSAKWADREDLIADIGSPAYLKDREDALNA